MKRMLDRTSAGLRRRAWTRTTGPALLIAALVVLAGSASAAVTPEVWKVHGSTSAVAHPSAVVVLGGTLRSGGAADLAADDDSYLVVDSTTRGIRDTNWYGKFPNIPKDITSLTVTYKGKNSLRCNQALSIRKWAPRNMWFEIDKRSVGAEEVEINDVPPGNLSNYVGGHGDEGPVWLRVRCKRQEPSFTTFADLLEITYTSPSGT